MKNAKLAIQNNLSSTIMDYENDASLKRSFSVRGVLELFFFFYLDGPFRVLADIETMKYRIKSNKLRIDQCMSSQK